MTEQEFCVVTRKKWLARKSLNKKRPLYKSPTDNALPEVDVPKFLSRLQRVRDQMQSSDYFQLSLTTLDESLKELDTDPITKLVCFGIGPFTRSIQALHQFGFILELQKHLNVADSLFFDPVFRDAEKEVLATLKCTLMKENCEAKYPSECMTLFYLPHCPTSLTNNLLWSNWSPEVLSRAVVINNSFESLSSGKPERLLRLEAGYLLDILPYTKEFALDDCYDTRNVFNDLSVHVFPASNLPKVGSDFWSPKEAPKYKDDDGEMVMAEGLEKLAID